MPEGRKSYSKTQPLQFEEFRPCLEWWKTREENERAWRVPAERIVENGYNLDVKNPNAGQDLEHLPTFGEVMNRLDVGRALDGTLASPLPAGHGLRRQACFGGVMGQQFGLGLHGLREPPDPLEGRATPKWRDRANGCLLE